MHSAREALIVAIADYHDPKLRRLRAPAADAEALDRVLADPSIGGFRVQTALDEDESTLSRRLARFFSDRRVDDLLLVHFSCHGIKDPSGELYMAATDTETDLLAATGIPSRWLNEQIGQCRSKRIVVFLDCCFSGSFPFGARARAGQNLNVQQHLEGRGRVVITASNAMEYSFEGDHLSGAGQPSVFTAAVVEGLETGQADRDGDHLVSVDELYEYLYDRVREATPNQTPTKLSSLEGPLYIARSSYERPVEPVALPQELVDLTQHPYAEARLGAVAELATLLESGNRGIALSARMTLERMVDDDSRKVAERARESLPRPWLELRAGAKEPEQAPASTLALDASSETVTTKSNETGAAAEPSTAGIVPEQRAKPVGRHPRTGSVNSKLRMRVRSLRNVDRNEIALIAAGVCMAAAASVIGSLLARPLYRNADFHGDAKTIAGYAIAFLPVAIALSAAAMLARPQDRSRSTSLVGILLATGVAAIAGLVHFNCTHPILYLVGVYAVAGAGLGVSSTLLTRQGTVVAIGVVVGVLGGALGGWLRPLAYATTADCTTAASLGAWMAANALAAAIAVAPLCVLIASRRSHRTESQPEPIGYRAGASGR